MTSKRRTNRTSPKPVQGQTSPGGLADAPGYVHGRTGAVRPEKHHTYVLSDAGVETVHRYDGKCHPGCLNVR